MAPLISDTLQVIHSLIQFVLSAQADAAGAPHHPGFGEVLSQMMPMFFIVFMIFYFMVLRPQTDKIKKQQQLISNLKKGDSIVTTGGIFGRVVGTEDDCVMLEISSNVRIKVEREHVAKTAPTKAAD